MLNISFPILAILLATTTGDPLPGEVIEVEIAKGVRMKFCWIPPGTATLGSPASEKERGRDETEYECKTKGFWLAKYPVTQQEWETVKGKNPSYFSKTGDGKGKVAGMDTSRFPIEQVSWTDCKDDFLDELNRTVQVPRQTGEGEVRIAA